METDKDVLTTGDVAKALHVSPVTVKQWIKRGKLKATRTPGGHFRIGAGSFGRFRRAHAFPQVAGWGPSVLVAVSDPQLARTLCRAIEGLERTARVEMAASAYQGLLRLGILCPDVLVLDLRLPMLDAVRFCQAATREAMTRATRIVVLRDKGEARSREMITAGASLVLVKPIRVAAFEHALRRLLDEAAGSSRSASR